MRKFLLGVGLGLAIFVSRTAFGDILAESTFDSGDEGWRVGEFNSAAASFVPTFIGSGGNPGGFIRTTDEFNFNAYHAPAPFLGNKAAAYGGLLHLEERVLSSDGIMQAMVLLSDGTLTLQFRTVPPLNSIFTMFDIPLLASAGWEINVNGVAPGPAATEAQLQQVLANLVFLNIDADWLTGGDQVDLDNVRLVSSVISAVPESGETLLLLSIAVIALGVSGKAAGERVRCPVKSTRLRR